ncbi:MAG: heparinase II/III family protein [Marinilabiliales bacterium]|nr:heparinase II/III family protein [Marinilabiliales bacterium]
MRKLLLLLLCWIFATATLQAQPQLPDIGKSTSHPRLLLLKGEEGAIQSAMQTNPVWKKMHGAILASCDELLSKPPVERIQIGRRLLDKSREALRRLFQLSYAWRMTGDKKYFDRAEQEMLAISRFSDWNPSHFLDVAEMTLAVSIGYDWLYNDLSESSRKIIRDAIVSKGLYPSVDPKWNSWLKAVNNWNQVCNTGMGFGALAVYEDHPEFAKQILERSISSIPYSMGEYKPDGAYPEGYGYWDYGTSFNVLFLSALDKVYHSDFGLGSIPGFLQTGSFFENMMAPSGKCFNWSDSGAGGSVTPALYWFAQKNKDLSLLWFDKGYLQTDDYKRFTNDRLIPAIMIWGATVNPDQITPPSYHLWKGQGANPVCMMRTSWTDPKALFVGFKVGSPSVNHGHMDIGSFIMEADGIRWAADFGMQDYESLESKGIQVFGRTQDAQRWSIFRINNKAHNTLTIDNQLQWVKGYAKIDKFSDNAGFMYALSDLSSVYQDQLTSLKRGVAIVDNRYVVVRDELQGTAKASTVRWTLLTSAKPTLKSDKILLEKEGKKLEIRISAPGSVKTRSWSTEPTTNYDAPNPGMSLVGFEFQLKPNRREAIEVLLVPQSAKGNHLKSGKELQKW